MSAVAVVVNVLYLSLYYTPDIYRSICQLLLVSLFWIQLSHDEFNRALRRTKRLILPNAIRIPILRQEADKLNVDVHLPQEIHDVDA